MKKIALWELAAAAGAVHLGQNAASMAATRIPAIGRGIGRTLNRIYRAGHDASQGPAKENIMHAFSAISPEVSVLASEARHAGHLSAEEAKRQLHSRIGDHIAATPIIKKMQQGGGKNISWYGDEHRVLADYLYNRSRQEGANPALRRISPVLGMLTNGDHAGEVLTVLRQNKHQYPGLANIAEGFRAEHVNPKWVPGNKKHSTVGGKAAKALPVLGVTAVDPIGGMLTAVKHVFSAKDARLDQTKAVQNMMSRLFVTKPSMRKIEQAEAGTPHRGGAASRFGYDLITNPITGELQRASGVLGGLINRGKELGY